MYLILQILESLCQWLNVDGQHKRRLMFPFDHTVYILFGTEAHNKVKNAHWLKKWDQSLQSWSTFNSTLKHGKTKEEKE